MSLEDHAGDIVFKARKAAGISLEDVAGVGGVSVEALENFEEYGGLPEGFKLDATASHLGLNAVKLRGVAGGWEPAPVDVSRWRELRMITTEQGMAVNCFVAWDPETREAALFDTGWEAEPILALADGQGLKLQHLFITHSHGDHIAAIGAVRERWPEIRLHSAIESAPAEQRVNPAEPIAVGRLKVSARLTPGHADDGVTYVVEGFPAGAPAVAVVGDAIFAGSMGGHQRAPELARTKVREEILSLPGETLVCPGHGPLSTVQEANDWIPFF